jgi:hypothetical protein
MVVGRVNRWGAPTVGPTIPLVVSMIPPLMIPVPTLTLLIIVVAINDVIVVGTAAVAAVAYTVGKTNLIHLILILQYWT